MAVLVRWIDNGSSRYDGKTEYIASESVIELNGVEGKFEEFKPGDKMVSITVYKHRRIKKWKAIVVEENPQKRHESEEFKRVGQKRTKGTYTLSKYCMC